MVGWLLGNMLIVAYLATLVAGIVSYPVYRLYVWWRGEQ